ncbi:hypothetical protein AB0I98_35465 [Streptomyces sp. NPDC050211]|uniref:hypothetical protein n=1 Tax=Streptomyces sp. NPDC050211 TaxID=3154932 RepID=UPI00343001E9
MLPEIRIRIQHPDEPDAYSWWDFTAEDAAEILAGRKFPYVAEIIDSAGRVLNDCSNLIAGPGMEGTYTSPELIPDDALAYYATDHWVPECGIEAGALIHHGDQFLRVMGPEYTDQEYGSIGYATGFLFCQPTTGGSPVRIWAEDATHRVREVTA